MKHKKGSLSQSFNMTVCIVFATLSICTILMIAFSTRLYKNTKFKELESTSNMFIQELSDELSVNPDFSCDDVEDLYCGFSENNNIKFYVYNSESKCILYPNCKNNKNNYPPISNSMKDRLDNGAFLEFDTEKISNKKQSILYGDSFTVQTKDGENLKFYLTSYSSTSDIDEFNIKISLCAFLTFLMCFLPAIFILKNRLNKHSESINNLLRIVEQYSKGDFSEHIEVTTPGNVKDIATYVNNIASNLKNADETSKTFISNVSHELRTPITIIGGYVDGILDGTISKSHQQEYLVIVSEEIKRLRIVINSMLNMSRFESGTLKPNFAETNLTELVIQIVLMFEKKIDEKNLKVIGLDSDRLIAVVDSNLIQQVIYNLVENAVKFVNEGGTLTFSFEKINDMCSISVRNTGDGLKDSEIQQVFDRFYKTDSSRGKDSSGLGLGLSISRRIVHLHNGEIIVRSVYGQYTEFNVMLPEKQNN